MFSYLFYTLCLLCCPLPSLVAGRSTNVTVDDSGVDPYSGQMLLYSSGWHDEDDCHHCSSAIPSAFNRTEHTVSSGRSSSQQEQTASFIFNGSAIYVYGILVPSSGTANLSFLIDGEVVNKSTYKSSSTDGSPHFNVTLYANNTIASDSHNLTLRWSADGGKGPPVLLDFLQYTREDDEADDDNDDNDDDGDGHGGHDSGSHGGHHGHSGGSSSTQTIIIACAVALTVVLVIVLLLLLYVCRRRVFRRRGVDAKKEKFVELKDRVHSVSPSGTEPYTYFIESGPPIIPETKGRILRLVNSPPSLSSASQTTSPSRTQPPVDVPSIPPVSRSRPMRPIPGARVVYPWRKQPSNNELPPSYEMSTSAV